MKAYQLAKIVFGAAVEMQQRIGKLLRRNSETVNDEKSWRDFIARQFFAGYAESDSIYDEN